MGTDASKRPYDLEERTAQFGEMVIDFAKEIPVNPLTTRIITQLVGAGTSVGANYCEAVGAESRKDFIHKIRICFKEAKETKFWLRMIARAVPALKEKSRLLWQEANELNLIFGSSIKTAKNNLTPPQPPATESTELVH